MEEIYRDTAKVLKALSDPKRLRILDMLSCGELCGCRILEAFHVTQPTLSHDLRILINAGLVRDRRVGKNTFYKLNSEKLEELAVVLTALGTPKPGCLCHKDEK